MLFRSPDLAWVGISLSSQAQTGRIYTSDDYSRAANLLNAGTISLVDHAVKHATFIGGDRFWYLDSENGLATLMVADATRRTKAPGVRSAAHGRGTARGRAQRDGREAHPAGEV